MKIEHFWHILKTEFEYKSPRTHRLPGADLPGWPTIIYYLKLFRVILSDNLNVRMNIYDNIAWANGSLDVLKLVESVGGKLHVSGLKALVDYRGPLVYIANHMSFLDTLVLPCLLLTFNKVTFVIKEGLLKYPFLGSIIRATDPIAVTRKSPREDLKMVLSKGHALISQGYSVAMFPQATRSANFDTSTFNSLGVKLAKKSGVPVVPIALKTDFQGNGKILKDMGAVDPQKSIYLKFGEPIAVEGGGQKTHQKIVRFISDNLREWGVDVKGL
ncbi:MAG: 1-acyl-sn-glycerol-3-phosphate acyltransferase [Desulfobacterales bacterium]|nr:MAG: 1-acyl-sn-glycerol-3-phosphate acyltransferase [Desulfobacterales bacterium]